MEKKKIGDIAFLSVLGILSKSALVSVCCVCDLLSTLQCNYPLSTAVTQLLLIYILFFSMMFLPSFDFIPFCFATLFGLIIFYFS